MARVQAATELDPEAAAEQAMVGHVLEQLFSGRTPVGEIKAIFRRIDKDVSGELDMGELRNAINALGKANGFEMSAEKTRSVMKYLDRDGDGSINFEEWMRQIFEGQLKVVRQKFHGCSITSSGAGSGFKKLFEFYDRDNEGSLGYDEFRRAVRRDAKLTVDVLPEESLKQMFEHLDDDGSQTLSYEEFDQFLNGGTKGPGRSVIDEAFEEIYVYFEQSGTNPRQLFQYFDSDGDADISVEEFVKGVKVLGLKMAASKLRVSAARSASQLPCFVVCDLVCSWLVTLGGLFGGRVADHWSCDVPRRSLSSAWTCRATAA